MKLSIITVNLNNRDGLKRTIDSVVSQTYRDFEWIVIDGGSTDGSKELIEEYSDHFAYWVSEPDKGIYNAMNKGVAHAKGEYCQFLNSGDWLAGKEVLEEAAKKMNGCDVLYGDIDFYKNGTLSRNAKFPDFLSFDDLFHGALGHNSCFICTGLLQEFPYDESLRIVSDWKFMFLMLLQGKAFKHIGKCIGCFDMSGISENQPELLNEEREKTLEGLAPLILQQMVEQRKETENHLAHIHLDEFCHLCERHRLLSKFITVTALLLKRI